MDSVIDKEKVQHAIKECVENGEKLLEEAHILFDWERYGRARALTILAAEEFAKAFVLHLVWEGVIPLTQAVRRSLRDHSSKHLMAIVMSWIPDDVDMMVSMGVEQWLKREFNRDLRVPPWVADAINLWRHQKLSRTWEPDWAYEKRSVHVADGELDRQKQNGLFVNLGSDCSVVSTPGQITRKDAEMERARVDSLRSHAARLGSYSLSSCEYTWLCDMLRLLFEEPVREEISEVVIPGIKFYCERVVLARPHCSGRENLASKVL